MIQTFNVVEYLLDSFLFSIFIVLLSLSTEMSIVVVKVLCILEHRFLPACLLLTDLGHKIIELLSQRQALSINLDLKFYHVELGSFEYSVR